MKQLRLRSFLIILLSILTQSNALGQAETPAKRITADLDDTLRTQRHFLATAIYQNGVKMPNSAISQLLASVPKATNKFRFGNVLKPIGPLLAVSGLVVGYIGIKGKPATAIVGGQRTPTNPNVPDVQVEYTKRSLPKVLGGLGLLIGGLCLVEVSSELTVLSVKLYNSRNKAISQLDNLKLGITTTGNIGLQARF
jgi:hypothetical protein